jgi:2-polyprenyl-3-methyl-5-hydroxy-6-metoxy-1,4-benzoquinol methylase
VKPLFTGSANGLPFNKNYWDDMYAEDEESVIDGIYNAEGHAKYLFELFSLMEVKINSIGDMGFGLGVLLKEFVRQFKPSLTIAIDPSEECVTRIIKEKWIKNLNIAIKQSTIEDFDIKFLKEKPLDLVICNSVLQYLPNKNIEPVFEKLATMAKYVYIAIPTTKDYEYMKNELNFTDPYAYGRSRNFYLKAWKKHFMAISHNLLESRYNVKQSPFLYELFRY